MFWGHYLKNNPNDGGRAPGLLHSLAADLLLGVVLLRELSQGGLDDAATQAQHQVQGGLCRTGMVSQTPRACKIGAWACHKPLVNTCARWCWVGTNTDPAVVHVSSSTVSRRGVVTSPQPDDRDCARTLLDVVVRQRAAILQLLTSEDQTLLIGGDACVRRASLSLD